MSPTATVSAPAWLQIVEEHAALIPTGERGHYETVLFAAIFSNADDRAELRLVLRKNPRSGAESHFLNIEAGLKTSTDDEGWVMLEEEIDNLGIALDMLRHHADKLESDGFVLRSHYELPSSEQEVIDSFLKTPTSALVRLRRVFGSKSQLFDRESNL